jgi:hypothetical protein
LLYKSHDRDLSDIQSNQNGNRDFFNSMDLKSLPEEKKVLNPQHMHTYNHNYINTEYNYNSSKKNYKMSF